LAAHPAVATTYELHLFSEYLREPVKSWERHATRMEAVLQSLERGEQPPDRLIGLPTVLSRTEFDDVSRGYLGKVVEQISSPGTEVVIEKTPSNSLMVPLIDRLLPEAIYIHIVRDPRDVASSLLDIGQTWGKGWAPRTSLGAALMWRAHVMGARQARQFGDRYIEIAYEHLKADPVCVLRAVLQTLGIDDDPALCTEIVADAQRGGVGGEPESAALHPDLVRRLGGHPVREPEGFGDGTVRRRRLSWIQEWIVESVDGRLMDGLDSPRRHPSSVLGERLNEAVIGAVTSRLSPEVKRWLGLNVGRLL